MRTTSLLVPLLFTLLVPSLSAAQAAEPCDTPRTAVANFLDNLQPDLFRPEIAIACFDFSGGPDGIEDRTRVARDLMAVLDGQGKYVVYADVPGNEDYTDPGTGLARVTLFPSLPNVRLERIDGGWKVSASTVAAVPKLYERTYRVPIQRWAQRLPPSLTRPVLGVAAWKLFGLLLLIVLSTLGGSTFRFVLGRFLRNTAQRFFASWAPDYERAILRWSARLVAAGLAALLLPNLVLPVRLNQFLFFVFQLAACVSGVLIVHSIVDFVADALARRAEATEGTMDDALVPLVRRMTKLVVDVAGALFVLQNLDVDIGSLLATLGLGGLAFALAAKESLSNLFGFLTIVADRPFQIGDWVVVGDVEGTIEEVGFRSTRVRTFYDSVVTLPNSKVADSTIDNMGQRNYRRFKVSLSLTYGASPDQIEAFVQGVRDSIEQSPYTRKDSSEVHFHTMADSSLDVLVYCFFEVDGWTDELRGRQGLMLTWMRLAEQVGVDFAYPTQTLHVESLPATS